MPTRKPGTSFDLSDFKLSKAHCELRTDATYLLWDRAGIIWTELSERIQGLQLLEVKPERQVARVPRRYELHVDLNRYSLHANSPDEALTSFAGIQSDLTATLEKYMQIEHYTRVGLRLYYAKEFDSQGAAIAYLGERGLCAFPDKSKKWFGVEGVPTDSRRIVKVEGETMGWSARVAVEERAYSLNLPIDWPYEPPEMKTKNFAVLDIDRYEFGLIPAGQINIADWIASTARAVKRDADDMVRELLAR